jgi:methyl-accepting chemotaxis protein
MKFPARARLIGALPVIVALLLSGAISFSYNRLLKEYRDAVDHTFRVLGAIDATLLRLQDTETGQRGFIITGNDSYLAPFRQSRDEIPRALDELGALVADKLDELQDTIATRRDEGFEPARRKVERNDGKNVMDSIRDVASTMRTTERALFDARVAAARFAERAMIGVALLCVALSLIGRYFAGYLTRRRDEPDAETG